MQSALTKGLAAAILVLSSFGATAADYCTVPYLYATNIRSACEQFGSRGLAGLYESSRFIIGMLLTHRKAARVIPRLH